MRGSHLILLAALSGVASVVAAAAAAGAGAGPLSEGRVPGPGRPATATAPETDRGGPPPGPRFADNGDGTVTDTRTGLVWLRDASCAALPRTDDAGRAYGMTARRSAAGLAEPLCGLADGSRAGDWRLPSRAELESLLDLGFHDPALSNAAGTARWVPDDPFTGVESTYYWSSTPTAGDGTYVWCVDLYDGVVFYAYEVNYYYVWPVRDGR